MADLLIPDENAAPPELAARLEFETLLADLSARFVNIPAEHVDGEIIEAQRKLCACLGLDRSALFQISAHDPGSIRLTHVHQPPDAPPPPKDMDARTFFPWMTSEAASGKTLAIGSMAEVPQDADRDRESFAQVRTKSALIIPLSAGRGPVIGILTFADLKRDRAWPELVVTRCRTIAQVFANALARKRSEDQLHRTLEELNRLKEQLQHENVYLRKEVEALQGQMPIVGNSESLSQAITKAQQVAATESTVLILGETGTGKELLAAYLHRIGRRSGKPFITTNIAAIPSTLLESELFGREKGAYTGALTKQIGRFEMADGGTLFLDEIGEMPLETQAKLLRVLQKGEFERLGSGQTLRANVQVIAATNRKLPELIREGKFRQDLYYRLNVFPITLPPLRDRPEDIPALVWAFVQEFSERMGKPIDRIRRKDLDALQRHDWPGNVRELRNVVERSMIVTDGPELRLVLPDAEPGQPSNESRALRDVERSHIQAVLKSAGGRIRGPHAAAEILGIKPTTLYSMMDRLGIEYRK